MSSSAPIPTQTEEEDGFSAPITHKRAPKNRKGAKNRPRERTLDEKLNSRLAPLESSGFLTACAALVGKALEKDNCPRPHELVCLGLGSVADSTKSQDQFHLLQRLAELLKDDLKAKPTVFDPVFSPEDIAFFTANDFTPLTAEHPLTLDRPTLLYMPHCPRSLFNLLLQRNWSRERLGWLVLLGNRLDMYDDPTHSSAQSRESSPFIERGAPLFRMEPLPADKRHQESFNDLALQWVPKATLEGLEEEFWKLREGQSSVGDAEKGPSLESALDKLAI